MKLRLSILLALLSLQCADDPNRPPNDPADEVIPVAVEAPPTLRMGSTTPVWVDLGTGGKTGPHGGNGARAGLTTVTWTASAGTISGEGDSVTFAPPDHPDTVEVSVVVRESDGTRMAGSTTIIVYRQWVILKADDFRYAGSTTVSAGWLRFIDYVEQRKIRASLGLIGVEIERGDTTFANLIRDLSASPRFEFWNHGYDHALNYQDSTGHTVSEFRGTGLEHQLDHIRRTQDLARERCGIVLHAFGAPGNAFDSNTTRALDACAEIGIWLYGATNWDGLVLPYTIRIEDPIFQPNEQAFVATYDPGPSTVTYQIHPKDWDQTRFDTFTRVVDFLIERQVTFTTPSDLERVSRKMVEE